MASRELLRIIRAARAGTADAQLALGSHYLFGGDGLPRNLATALHWLDRAARQQRADAWTLIGMHIPHETAQLSADMPQLLIWYENAFEAGVMQAAVTLGRLLQTHGRSVDASWPARSARMLQQAARAGIADAQWLLAQQHDGNQNDAEAPSLAQSKDVGDTPLEWAVNAADAGILAARHALAERAWAVADYAAFLRWSLPMARALVGRS